MNPPKFKIELRHEATTHGEEIVLQSQNAASVLGFEFVIMADGLRRHKPALYDRLAIMDDLRYHLTQHPKVLETDRLVTSFTVAVPGAELTISSIAIEAFPSFKRNVLGEWLESFLSTGSHNKHILSVKISKLIKQS